MYNPITEKDRKMIAYHKALDETHSSLFPRMNLKKILFNDCLSCQGNNSLSKAILKNLFFVTEKLETNLKGSPVLCLYTKNYRNDHDGYWEKIKEDVGASGTYVAYDSVTFFSKIPHRLDLMSFPRKLGWFVTSMRELSGIENFTDRVYLSVMLAARKWTFEEVKKLKLEPKLVMCYFDSGTDENVLIQYFKDKGAITVTNQHGLCIYKSKEYDLMNQSQILNFKSDYFLARSEKQKEEFVRAGFDADRIIVVGYIGNGGSEVKLRHTGVVGLFLDTPTVPLGKQSNETLIEYAEKLSGKIGFKYIVKCHPHDDVKRYEKIVSDRCVGLYGREISIRQALGMVDLGIVHASASYVDSYEAGVRCLKYCSEVYFPIAVKEDEFSSCEELEKVIKLWDETSDAEKAEWITNIRSKYAGKWEDGNIRRAVDELLNSKAGAI